MQLPYLCIRSGSVIDPYPFNFYSFASSVHPLASLRGGTEFRGNSDLVSLFNDANIIADYFRLNPFCATHLSSAAEKLKGIQEILKSYLYIQPPENKPMPETIMDLDTERLKELVQEFETILADELSKLPIFCLEDEKIGNFSIKKLLKGASNGYPDKTRNCLTLLCKAEIDEAGNCLDLRKKHCIWIPYTALH